jgi:hypothetical protein
MKSKLLLSLLLISSLLPSQTVSANERGSGRFETSDKIVIRCEKFLGFVIPGSCKNINRSPQKPSKKPSNTCKNQQKAPRGYEADVAAIRGYRHGLGGRRNRCKK